VHAPACAALAQCLQAPRGDYANPDVAHERRTKLTLQRDRRELASLVGQELAQRSSVLGVNQDPSWLFNPIDDLFLDVCDGMPPERLHFDERVSGVSGAA
jgi:hypothetical protein